MRRNVLVRVAVVDLEDARRYLAGVSAMCAEGASSNHFGVVDLALNRCTEALASVSESTLMSEVVEYDIQSWTPDAIVLRKDMPCAIELFTIDLNTKAVSGAGHRINENDLFCKPSSKFKNERSTWTYQLVNGFQVYWGLRQKARPLLLRVIQSIFGN